MGGFGRETNPLSQAQAELKELLEDPKHNPADIPARVEAVRKARQQAQADLQAAREDLLLLLIRDQELLLISLGYLE